MPTIDFNNTNTSNPPPANPAPASTNSWDDPWGSSWANPPASAPQARLTPQERVGMIERVYKEVLGRNADTKDINYYKYSTLSEDEIRRQLLAGTEHSQVVADGREYKRVKERALQAETRVKMLEGQIRDQIDEFKQLTDLLKEKNNHIRQLREQLNRTINSHPFKIIEESPVPNTLITPNAPIFSTPTPSQPPKAEPVVKPLTFADKIRRAIESLL